MALWNWQPARRGRLRGPRAEVALQDLATHSALGGRLDDLRGRNVLLALRDPLRAAVAMLELDGVARRMVLCTPDLDTAVLDAVARQAEAEVRLDDEAVGAAWAPCERRGGTVTEWVLLTSGTSGLPKLVVHTLDSLAGGLTRTPHEGVWGTFYDIRRYGGLQILLRALLGGSDFVMTDADEPLTDFVARAAGAGITHLTGTPTHWRRVLQGGLAGRIAPHYVRMSGEIADQAILDRLAAAYPTAQVAHAFASTEAGVAFAVEDGRAGFPADLLRQAPGAVEMKLQDGSLRIRSPRVALRYLGDGVPALTDAEGFVDTKDHVELRDGRCLFAGRGGGIINVGGLKVHPEEVEAVLNADPRVRLALVRARRSALVGSLVAADVVLQDAAVKDEAALRHELLEACRARLAPHKVPATLRFVPDLAMTPAGKLVRPLG